MATSAVRRRAPRKSAAESRELILAAARNLFGRQGFTNTTVKEVAVEAGVAEIVVYRIFGTKMQLFEDAVFSQLVDAIVGWLADWGDRDVAEASSYESGRAYIESIYRMVSANRGQIMALLSAEAFEINSVGEGATSSPINLALHRIETLIAHLVEANDWRGVDVALATRAAFGMVFSVAMFPDTLLPLGSERPDADRLIDEMAAMMLYGVSARP